MKVSDVICKWYILAVVGYVIGINLNDTLGGACRFGNCWKYRMVYTKKS